MKCFSISLGQGVLSLHKGGVAICDGGALQCYGNDKDGVEQEFLVSGVAYGIVSQLPPERCEVCNPELKKPKLAVVHKMPTTLDTPDA